VRKVTVLLVVLAAAGLATVTFMSFRATKAPPTEKIVWNDFENGMKLAHTNNLPMMIDFAASWCGWCKDLDDEVYNVPEVIALSRNFVCVRVDGDREKEVADYFNVTGYPTIVFTNSKIEEVDRIPGFMPADGFLAQMRAALEKVGGAHQVR